MRTLMTRLTVASVAVLIVVALSACASAAKSKKISTSDVPGPVMASINARFPGAQLTSVERENENGGVIYDFELRQGGRKFEADVKADGTIIEVEKEVPAAEVPDAVTSAVKAKYPGATIREIMEVDKVSGQTETPDHYEVNLKTSGGKEKEVTASLDGSRVNEEEADEGGNH